MSRKHDRNHFPGAVSVNIVNIRGPALTLGTVNLVNFRSGKILQPRRNERHIDPVSFTPQRGGRACQNTD